MSEKRIRGSLLSVGVAAFGAATCMGMMSGGHAEAQQTKRVMLRVLVLSSNDVGTSMVKAGLDEALVPYTEVNLTQQGRPIIDGAFLAGWDSTTIRRANFQAVVLPNEAPEGLTAAER